jgi:hypothetical protein
MADNSDFGSKPISSGKAPGPHESLRDDSILSTNTSQAMDNTEGTNRSSLQGSTTGATGTGTTNAGSSTSGMSGTSSTYGASGSSSSSGSVSGGSTIDGLKQSGSALASDAKQYAGDLANRAKEKGRTLFEQQKETAVGQVGSVANAIRSTASNLQGEGQDTTARYVNMLADQLENLGGKLREKNLDNLVTDFQGYARRSPGTFLVGSVVAGFFLARFLKSSSERQQYQLGYEGYEGYEGSGRSSGYSGRQQSMVSGSEAGLGDTDRKASSNETSIGSATGAAAGTGTGIGTGTSTSTGSTATGSTKPDLNGSNIGGTRL